MNEYRQDAIEETIHSTSWIEFVERRGRLRAIEEFMLWPEEVADRISSIEMEEKNNVS